MMKENSLDPRLYLVLGPENCPNGDVVSTAVEAAKGGVTLVQYRNKTGGTRCMIADVAALKRALAPFNIPVLVNDRVDVVLAADADGVHLGQSDMPVELARGILGPEKIVGLTVKAEAHLHDAPAGLLDYWSIGGVFPTRTKNNPDAPVGPDGLARLVQVARELSPMPITAIAGVTLENLETAWQAGVDGVAVVSAICAAADIRGAAESFRNRIDELTDRQQQEAVQ